ncbi:DUF4844 domain-containing protein [Phocaeicola sp.]
MKQAQLSATELQQIDEKIEAYKVRDKFVENDDYPGIGNEEMREPLNNLLNLLADSFQKVAHENPDNKLYQLAMRQLLVAMKGVYLDSEDQDQFCISIEELMNIVGLESSGGLLNKWRYGL